jgi:hypothetical protein
MHLVRPAPAGPHSPREETVAVQRFPGATAVNSAPGGRYLVTRSGQYPTMALNLPPHRKQALRAFALQILNTTLAVLIALSFENLVDRYRIHNLVATARAHMDSEIAEKPQGRGPRP